MSKARFVNPYNFIPLKEKCIKKERETGTYTGVIKYSLLTKTPLFIANTSNKQALYTEDELERDGKEKKLSEKDISDLKEHKSYEFFSYTDLSEGNEDKGRNSVPVIPGSEMRGMLRSNYEILTNSCLSAIDDDVVLSKRTREAFKPGLLMQNGDAYDLYEAEDCIMRTMGAGSLIDDWVNDEEHYKRKCYIQKDFKEGEEVFFEYIERPLEKGYAKPLAKKVSLKYEEGKETGYIIKGEDGPEMAGRDLKQQKHCCHVFRRGILKRENVSVSLLEACLTEYRNQGVHLYQEYYEEFEKFKNGEKGEYFPVYYSVLLKNEKELYPMLSPSCFTREIYQMKLKDMIGTYKTCKEEKKLCPACTLFGTVGKDFAVSSRIRISDLQCEKKGDYYDQIVTLKPLSSPKLNNMEFYMRRPENAWFWTYDYFIDKKQKLHILRPGQSQINGRKFYWHQMGVKLENQEKTKLNMSIRPVKANVIFCGKLYFENLTKEELDQLIYLLNTGEDIAANMDDNDFLKNKRHGYKLGGGKPLGLGSVALCVNYVKLRKVEKDVENRSVTVKEEDYGEYQTPNFDKEIINNFSKMTDFYTVENQNVSYPLTGDDNKPNIFDWFTGNHKAYHLTKKEYTDSPNQRRQMLYMEYMEPMNPELKEVEGIREEIKEKQVNNNKRQNYSVQKNNKYSGKKKW